MKNRLKWILRQNSSALLEKIFEDRELHAFIYQIVFKAYLQLNKKKSVIFDQSKVLRILWINMPLFKWWVTKNYESDFYGFFLKILNFSNFLFQLFKKKYSPRFLIFHGQKRTLELVGHICFQGWSWTWICRV